MNLALMQLDQRNNAPIIDQIYAMFMFAPLPSKYSLSLECFFEWIFYNTVHNFNYHFRILIASKWISESNFDT